MASTNKTTHYELSQYVSSDKPTYLVDYNGDMAKIDTAINTAKTTADTANTSATNAQTAAEGAQSTANTAITNAATADTKATTANTNIGTMANLNTTEKQTLVGAINEVNDKQFVVDSMEGSETTKAPSVFSVKQKMAIGQTISSNEYDTGKIWVDGKKIYGKYISLGSLPNNGRKEVSTGLSNINLIDIKGVLHNSAAGFYIEFPDIINSTELIAYADKIVVITTTDYSGSTAFVHIEYTKN